MVALTKKDDNAVPVFCCMCQLLTVPIFGFENRNQNVFINIVVDSGAMIKGSFQEAILILAKTGYIV